MACRRYGGLTLAAAASSLALVESAAEGQIAGFRLSDFPFTLSKEYDLWNQAEAVKYFEAKFYHGDLAVLNDQELQEADTFRQYALQEPVLALAAAQVLYMFGWFRASGEILRENVVAAADLFERSISVSSCKPESSSWYDDACEIRYMHAILLYTWLSETETVLQQAEAFRQKAFNVFDGIRRVSRYGEAVHTWLSPVHLNFNAVKFPGRPSFPIWETSSLPIGRWLEEHHHVFKADLEAIINDPRGLYKQLMKLDPSREHLASPGGWDTLRVVRYHHWFDLFCEAAPRTCDLIKSRPEIAKCDFMNVNYVRLNPGAHLKPHFGNGPRLTAHLSVIAPEPLRSGMTVANQRALWQEGKSIIFDDTYPHMVSHWGDLPRYVMLVWFCHPCDTTQEHGQVCPTS
jgi:hypothetical protein